MRGKDDIDELTDWLKNNGQRGQALADVINGLREQVQEWRKASYNQSIAETELRDENYALKNQLRAWMTACYPDWEATTRGYADDEIALGTAQLLQKGGNDSE